MALRRWASEARPPRGLEAAARRGYEEMRAFLVAQIDACRVRDTAGLLYFIECLEGAIRRDVESGGDAIEGQAKLAFWSEVRRRLQRRW